MLVSGGVDSTVCAALLHKALKEDQVIAVHIDNGFMRKNESQQVEESLKKLGLKLRGSLHFRHSKASDWLSWPTWLLRSLRFLSGFCFFPHQLAHDSHQTAE
jgi:tRNA(Ile)-lysidine synthase TilS/MesJ